MNKRLRWEIAVLFSLTVIYGLHVLYNSVRFYQFVRNDNRVHGRIYQVDDERGYDNRPLSSGYFQFPTGLRIPMLHDAQGFRISTATAAGGVQRGPLILALGSSFTYGHACLAEETFPNLVAKKLGGKVLNGGVCGYSLAQMHIKARQLIPLCKPTYALVEYAVWMPERSQSPLWQRTFGGVVPSPYYYESNGSMLIHEPPFLTRNFDVPIEYYEALPDSILNFCGFLFRVGIPFNFYNDTNTFTYKWKVILGRLPRPESDLRGGGGCIRKPFGTSSAYVKKIKPAWLSWG